MRGLSLLPPSLRSWHNVVIWLDGKEAIDRRTKTALTATNITYATPPTNIHDGIATVHNGTTSGINCGSQVIGTGTRTLLSWICPAGWGENNLGTIMNNGKFVCGLVGATQRVAFQSDGATSALAANASVALDAWQLIAVTRNATGAANLYVNAALTGTANQASGTPASGSTNLIIGNNNGGSNTFNGQIGLTIVLDKVLTLAEIKYFYNRTK